MPLTWQREGLRCTRRLVLADAGDPIGRYYLLPGTGTPYVVGGGAAVVVV
jgi:hypothetical protein